MNHGLIVHRDYSDYMVYSNTEILLHRFRLQTKDWGYGWSNRNVRIWSALRYLFTDHKFMDENQMIRLAAVEKNTGRMAWRYILVLSWQAKGFKEKLWDTLYWGRESIAWRKVGGFKLWWCTSSDIIQPDLVSAGGILKPKKICWLCWRDRYSYG